MPKKNRKGLRPGITSENTLTDAQLNILDKRREDMLSAKVGGMGWQTIHNNVKEKRMAALGK